jgi:hypothetical protein
VKVPLQAVIDPGEEAAGNIDGVVWNATVIGACGRYARSLLLAVTKICPSPALTELKCVGVVPIDP